MCFNRRAAFFIVFLPRAAALASDDCKRFFFCAVSVSVAVSLLSFQCTHGKTIKGSPTVIISRLKTDHKSLNYTICTNTLYIVFLMVLHTLYIVFSVAYMNEFSCVRLIFSAFFVNIAESIFCTFCNLPYIDSARGRAEKSFYFPARFLHFSPLSFHTHGKSKRRDRKRAARGLRAVFCARPRLRLRCRFSIVFNRKRAID